MNILTRWAAKLNEFEIGHFTVAGNFILFDDRVRILRRVSDAFGDLYYELFFYESGMDGYEFSSCAFCLPRSYTDITPRQILANALPHYALYIEQFDEKSVLTGALGAALGWRLFGRDYDLEIGRLAGVNLYPSCPLENFYDCDVDIFLPPFDMEINPKNYDVTLRIRLWLGRNLESRQCAHKIHPSELARIGYDGICRMVSLLRI